jgi:hypothetical protein
MLYININIQTDKLDKIFYKEFFLFLNENNMRKNKHTNKQIERSKIKKSSYYPVIKEL